MKRSALILVGLALVVPLVTIQCGPQPEAKRISIATGGTGGVYYPYGGGLAKLISQYVPNTEATAEVTAASVDNCKLINDGKADLALIMADVGYDALQGTGKFKETGKMALRTLANLYGNYMHLVTAEGSGINTVADLKGKKISTGAPGSGTEVKALRVLEAYGIDPAKDTKQEKLGVSESAAAMKDRKLDAFFWDGGLPTAAILDLSATPGFKMKLISHEDAIPKMVEKYGPVYFKLVIPKGTYGGVEADTSVAGVANLLIASDKFDEKLAYNILKAMFDHKPDLVAVHKEAEKLTLQSAVVGSPLPFHPGAIRYYKEKGVWK